MSVKLVNIIVWLVNVVIILRVLLPVLESQDVERVTRLILNQGSVKVCHFYNNFFIMPEIGEILKRFSNYPK